MTDLQYLHWKNFSMRMAVRGFDLRLRRSRRRLAWFVKDFFRMFEHNYLHDVRTYPNLFARISGWDQTESIPGWSERGEHASIGPYVCSIVDEDMERWNPHYWADDRRSRRWDDLWGCRIRSCIRAGMDLAVAPSAGVLGFTAGDIRRMYRGRVPAWIFGDARLEIQHIDGVIPGVGLKLGKTELDGTFAELKDGDSLWL